MRDTTDRTGATSGRRGDRLDAAHRARVADPATWFTLEAAGSVALQPSGVPMLDEPRATACRGLGDAAVFEAAAPLTLVELQILDDAARGLTVKESAVRRWKSVWTVKAQRRSILTKLGARNMAHAVSLAIRRQLIAPMPDDVAGRRPGSAYLSSVAAKSGTYRYRSRGGRT